MRISKLLVVATLLCVSQAVIVAAGTPDETAAQRGYRTLLTVPLGPPLLTLQQYENLWKVWPEPARSQAEKASPKERLRLILTYYGFQESPDRPGPVPHQLTSDGKGNLSENCLACHGGSVDGKVILGLGNSLIDVKTFYADVARIEGAAGATPLAAPAVAPVWPEVPVRGLNNAWGAAISFMSVRDKNLNVTDKLQFPLKLPDQVDIPLKTPPFWLSRKKTRYYYNAFIGKSHRDIMQFAFGFQRGPKEIEALEPYFKDIFAWINSLQAPKYPGPIDAALARRGRLIYLKSCASCHGGAGPTAAYPERVVPVAEVGTDPVRALDFSVAFERSLGEGWVGDYGKTPLYPGTNGYVAPPLDGIWANAPYLHNGSVPTMWDLLTPDQRPAVWRRTDTGYDRKKLGLEVTTYDKLPANIPSTEMRHYYQTNQRGLGNQGHRYPAAGLSDAEKWSLIEYLKTF
jgi:mono/diheme cytochrome c family protein